MAKDCQRLTLPMQPKRWIVLFLLLTSATSLRADDGWRDGQYSKRLVQGEAKSVGSLLRDFGQAQRIPVIVNEDVTGNVIVQYPTLAPEDYLNAICSDNGLFWFEKNNIIFVYASDQLDSKILPLGNVDPAKLINALRGFNLYSKTFPPKIDRDLGLVYVTGPAAYLAEVEKIIASIANASITAQRSPEVRVEVFNLQYAWADDRSFTLGNREVAVPGIASILRSVLTGKGEPPRSTSQLLPNNRPGLRGAGLIGPYNQLVASSQQAAVDSQVAAAQAEARYEATAAAQQQISDALAAIEESQDGGGGNPLASTSAAVIQADPRLNAIIIKDTPDRLARYGEIIRRLDVPVSLVEIKASIIDVDATHGFEFGLPTNVTFNDGGTQRSLLANIRTPNLASVAGAGNLTFQLADGAVNQLLVNLKALEQDGHARLLSKPAVVTLDNQDAFLEESEEFFVRVQGNQQVDLFNVTVGTKLNITPHIIRDPSGRRIRLSVNIEDGSRSATQQVDQIPVVSRNSINTQAVLMEGQSLLIGGLTRERETKNIRAVPVLGRIPKVGGFFRETIHETARLERLILLKPTVIDLPTFEPNGMQGLQSPLYYDTPNQEASVLLPDVPFHDPQRPDVQAPRQMNPIDPAPIAAPPATELQLTPQKSGPREGASSQNNSPFSQVSSSRTLPARSGFGSQQQPTRMDRAKAFTKQQLGRARDSTQKLLDKLPFRKNR